MWLILSNYLIWRDIIVATWEMTLCVKICWDMVSCCYQKSMNSWTLLSHCCFSLFITRVCIFKLVACFDTLHYWRYLFFAILKYIQLESLNLNALASRTSSYCSCLRLILLDRIVGSSPFYRTTHSGFIYTRGKSKAWAGNSCRNPSLMTLNLLWLLATDLEMKLQ